MILLSGHMQVFRTRRAGIGSVAQRRLRLTVNQVYHTQVRVLPDPLGRSEGARTLVTRKASRYGNTAVDRIGSDRSAEHKWPERQPNRASRPK